FASRFRGSPVADSSTSRTTGNFNGVRASIVKQRQLALADEPMCVTNWDHGDDRDRCGFGMRRNEAGVSPFKRRVHAEERYRERSSRGARGCHRDGLRLTKSATTGHLVFTPG